MEPLRIVPADDTIPAADVISVFGERGDASRCFCQFFCAASFRSGRRHNLAALRNQLTEQTPGLLAYRGEEPVGWVQVGPLERYPRFVASAGYGGRTAAPPPGTWAVTCFVVPVKDRRDGVAGHLLDAAVDFARTAGARAIDAHPVDLRGSTSRPASSELYVGVLGLFTRRGFRVVGRTSPRRPMVRRRLTTMRS